jgi:hypothetical protein
VARAVGIDDVERVVRMPAPHPDRSHRRDAAAWTDRVGSPAQRARRRPLAENLVQAFGAH